MTEQKYTARQLARQISELISLPNVYLEVKRVLEDKYSTIDELAKVLSQDPAMAARVLRIANSAFFGVPQQFDSISRAVNLLGFQHVHDVVFAASVSTAFKKVDVGVMDMNHFWTTSMFTAISAKLIAAKCNVLDTERLFLAGILHDIGHLVMYCVIPEETESVFLQSREKRQSQYRMEEQLIGCHYADVAAELMQIWMFPGSIIETVKHQVDPATSENLPLDASIIHIAAQLGRIATSDVATGLDRIEPFALRITNLDDEEIKAIQLKATDLIIELINLFFPQTKAVLITTELQQAAITQANF